MIPRQPLLDKLVPIPAETKKTGCLRSAKFLEDEMIRGSTCASRIQRGLFVKGNTYKHCSFLRPVFYRLLRTED